MGSLTQPKIPVIDFSKQDLKPGTISWIQTSKAVCNALEELGCFEVILDDHKVPLDLHSTIFGSLKELYDLPLEIKVKNKSDKPFRGYFSANPVHEGMGIDNATSLEGTQKFANLMWPEGNDCFCESAQKIANIIKELDEMVTRMAFESYGAEKHYESHIGSMGYALRFSKYKENVKYEGGNVGLSSHTDKTFSTILKQDQVNGLEVQTKDGEWIVYNPSSHSSFLYTAGDAFKVWSNGRVRPCYHRVIMNGKDRYSLGLFTFNEGVIQVPEELVDDEHPLQFKPFDQLAYLKMLMTKACQKIEFPVENYCGI